MVAGTAGCIGSTAAVAVSCTTFACETCHLQTSCLHLTANRQPPSVQMYLAKTAEGKPVTMCKLLKPWRQDLLEPGPAASPEAVEEGGGQAAGPMDADKAPEELLMDLLLQAGTVVWGGLRLVMSWQNCASGGLPSNDCTPLPRRASPGPDQH